jgi:hypothetical protein
VLILLVAFSTTLWAAAARSEPADELETLIQQSEQLYKAGK